MFHSLSVAVFIYASLCFPVSVSIYASLSMSLCLPPFLSPLHCPSASMTVALLCVSLCLCITLSLYVSMSLSVSVSWEPSMGFGVHLGTPKCHLGNQGRHLVILG